MAMVRVMTMVMMTMAKARSESLQLVSAVNLRLHITPIELIFLEGNALAFTIHCHWAHFLWGSALLFLFCTTFLFDHVLRSYFSRFSTFCQSINNNLN